MLVNIIRTQPRVMQPFPSVHSAVAFFNWRTAPVCPCSSLQFLKMPRAHRICPCNDAQALTRLLIDFSKFAGSALPKRFRDSKIETQPVGQEDLSAALLATAAIASAPTHMLRV